MKNNADLILLDIGRSGKEGFWEIANLKRGLSDLLFRCGPHPTTPVFLVQGWQCGGTTEL
jgi:hypothetical protein